MFNPVRIMILAFSSILLPGQQIPFQTYVTPSSLFAGSGPSIVTLSNQDYAPGLIVRWNGSPRVTSQGSQGTSSINVNITASDLATSQLAQITVVNPQSGTVVDTINYPVTYNVVPTGAALDATRNVVYLATPAQPGDTRFPGNSVVALNVNTGKIGPILQIGKALGDLALSDDASALYVVVEGESVVRRIDPATFTAAGDFIFRPSGSTSNGQSSDVITVLPGKTSSVAVGFTALTSAGPGLLIYDDGVPRQNGLIGYSGLLFSPDGKYLFQSGEIADSSSPNSADNYPAIFRYSVDSTGIPKQIPVTASGSGPTAIVNGTLYTSLATAIDYASMRITGSFGIGGPVAVDPSSNRAFVLYAPPSIDEGVAPPVKLVAFSLPTLEPLGSQAVGLTALSTLKDSEKLIRFGVDGFLLPSSSGLLVFHTPLAGPAPSTTSNAVVNAASQKAGPIAPGEVLTIYGVNLGPANAQSAVSIFGTIPSLLDNVQVWFGQVPGIPLLVYQGQINVVAPFELQPGSAVDIQVLYYGNPSAKVSLPVVSAAPALFTQHGSGLGPVTVINQDGSINTASPAGSIVTLYGTGGGIVGNAMDGALARSAANLAAPPGVTIGGQNAPVIYAGAAPGLVDGVFQLNVQLPNKIPSGPAAIAVSSNGQKSPQGVTLEIR